MITINQRMSTMGNARRSISHIRDAVAANLTGDCHWDHSDLISKADRDASQTQQNYRLSIKTFRAGGH